MLLYLLISLIIVIALVALISVFIRVIDEDASLCTFSSCFNRIKLLLS